MTIGWVTSAESNPDFIEALIKRGSTEVLQVGNVAVLDKSALAGFDVILYDFGNPPYLQPVPGIIVLRDVQSALHHSHLLRGAIGVIAFSSELVQQAQASFTGPITRLSHSEQDADEILTFISEARSARPLLELADRLSAELKRMGIAKDAKLVDTLTRTLEELFVRENG